MLKYTTAEINKAVPFGWRRTNKERVARGAAWLDEVQPDWYVGLDVKALDLSNACKCVLGQLVNDRLGRDIENTITGFCSVVNRLAQPQVDTYGGIRPNQVPLLEPYVMTYKQAVHRGFQVEERRGGAYTDGAWVDAPHQDYDDGADYAHLQDCWVSEVEARRALPVLTYVSEADVKAELLKLADSTQHNPFDEWRQMCVYQDDQGNHCVAGQVLVNLGGVVPKDPSTGRFVNGSIACMDLAAWGLNVSLDAEDILRRAQWVADGNRGQTPWYEVVSVLKARGLLD